MPHVPGLLSFLPSSWWPCAPPSAPRCGTQAPDSERGGSTPSSPLSHGHCRFGPQIPAAQAPALPSHRPGTRRPGSALPPGRGRCPLPSPGRAGLLAKPPPLRGGSPRPRRVRRRSGQARMELAHAPDPGPRGGSAGDGGGLLRELPPGQQPRAKPPPGPFPAKSMNVTPGGTVPRGSLGIS